MTTAPEVTLVPVCPAASLTADRGVAALVGDVPVAVFLLATGELAAVDDVDPFTGVGVLSRGIVGDVDGRPTVASPLHKQRFDLRTGGCLDADGVRIRVHAVVVVCGVVHVGVRTPR